MQIFQQPVQFTFTEKELIAKTVVLLLIKAQGSDGKHYYAYVAVKAEKLPELIKAKNAGPYQLKKYGMILESGLGEPSWDIQYKMQQKYGFNHSSEHVWSDGKASL